MTGTYRLLSGNKRPYSVSGQARFKNPPMTEPTPRENVSLGARHPAVVHGKSVFSHRVFDASERDRVLIDGINNAKTGRHIEVGPWKGLYLYNLSLEERATCPRSCSLWRECFGNKMPMAVRFRYNPALMMSIDGELCWLSMKHPRGFAVRLHILGDFPDVDYLRHWADWSDQHPALHVWGYTAHSPESEVGSAIAKANDLRPDRWRIRFSVPEGRPHAPMQVTTTWTKPDKFAFDAKTQSMVCPQEIGKTDHCATCGICWKPEMAHVRVVFLGHGGRSGRPAVSPTPPTPQPVASEVTRPPLRLSPLAIPGSASEADAIARFIATRGVKRLAAGRAFGVPK